MNSVRKICPDDGLIVGILVDNDLTNVQVINWKNTEESDVKLSLRGLETLQGQVRIWWSEG
jgi:hypothetical protein